MGLLQNISVLSAEPIRNSGGAAAQCIIRSSYNRSEQQLNRYISFANIDKKSGVPNGYAPPYSIVMPLKDGGMSCYSGILGSSYFLITSLSLGKALSSISKIIGNGNIITNLKGISHCLSNITANGDISFANIISKAILIANLNGEGTIDISSIIKLLYYCIANLQGFGEISAAEVKLLSGLTTDLIIGSGSIDDSTSLGMLSFLNSTLTGVSIVDADLIGFSNFVSSLSGSSLFVGNATLLSGISSELIGIGDLTLSLKSVIQLLSTMLGDGELTINSFTLLGHYLSSISGSGDIYSSDLRSYAQMISNLNGSGAISALVNLTGLLWLLSVSVGEGNIETNLKSKCHMDAEISLTGAILTAANCAKAVWDSLAVSFNEPGTMGEKLNAAGTAGDPWTAELPGSYVEGTAGYIIGNEFNTIIDKLNTLLDVEQGNWEIKENQMIFYKIDGTELMRFDLLDANGDPTMTSPYSREIV